MKKHLVEVLATLPMTFAIGGPTVNGNGSSYGFYYLEPGSYLVVDISVDPPRYTKLQVNGTTVDTSEPSKNVDVKMAEYAFSMPDIIESDPQLWKFFNQGQFPHNFGIVQMSQGKSLDDVIDWMYEQSGPPPFEVQAFWNVMSPAATSRMLNAAQRSSGSRSMPLAKRNNWFTWRATLYFVSLIGMCRQR